MQYLFDFSKLPESATKYASLSLIKVSDEFLHSVVERFLETKNRLTVLFNTSTDNAQPVEYDGFEETVFENGGRTRFRYDHCATRTTFISQPWMFFITNVPDENVKRHGQPQNFIDLHSAYQQAYRRGDTYLLEKFPLQDPLTTATTAAAELPSPSSLGKVTCETSDQKKVDVDIEVLRQSHTFDYVYSALNLGEGASYPGVYSVPNVDARIFKKVIEWCTKHTDKQRFTGLGSEIFV